MLFKGIRKGVEILGFIENYSQNELSYQGYVLLERYLFSFYSTNIRNDFNFCTNQNAKVTQFCQREEIQNISSNF